MPAVKFSATPSCMIFTVFARNRPRLAALTAAEDVGELLGAAAPVPPQCTPTRAVSWPLAAAAR